MVEGGGSHLGSSSRHCPCPFMFVGSRLRSCAFVCARARSFSFAGSHIHLWGVVFVCGWSGSGSHSFVGGRVRSGSCLRLFVGSRDVDEVWWWWAVGGWWWWLLLMAVAWWWGQVVGCHKRRRQTTMDVVVRHLVATSYLVGVKKEVGRVLVPAYLGCTSSCYFHI